MNFVVYKLYPNKDVLKKETKRIIRPIMIMKRLVSNHLIGSGTSRNSPADSMGIGGGRGGYSLDKFGCKTRFHHMLLGTGLCLCWCSALSIFAFTQSLRICALILSPNSLASYFQLSLF